MKRNIALKDKKSEEIREKQRLASFPKLNPNPVLEVDEIGKIVFENQAAQKYAKNLYGRGSTSVFLPKDINIILKHLKKNGSGKFYREVEVAGTAFGEDIYVSKEFGTLRIYANDITEQKKAETSLRQLNHKLEERVRERTVELSRYNAALKDSQRRYEELWNNAPVAYHILDRHGIIKQVNKTETHLLGYSTEEMTGKSIFNFILPEQRESAKQRFKLKLSGERVAGKSIPRKEERVYVKKDGTPFYVSIQDVVEKDKKGKVVGVRTTMVDITERVRAGEALRASENLTKTINVLLRLSNTAITRKEYLDAVLKHLQSLNGYKYAGIRILDENRNIPFDAYVGFDHKFWQAENFLSASKDQCSCIRVINGHPDSQEKTAMTKQGSFQCNNLAHFFSDLNSREKKRYRGTCLRYGFLSLAVVPIRFDGRILGAIHVADKKVGQLPKKNVEFIEALVPTIGEAINKFNAADKLRESNALLRKSQEQLIEAYKHLGTINRKISLLLEMEKHEQGKRKKQIANYILGSAINLARAEAGLIYQFEKQNGDKKFNLVAHEGLSSKKQKDAKELTGKNCPLLKSLAKHPVRMQGRPEDHGIGKAPLAEGMKYFLLLPLLKENKLKGFILLEFHDKKNMDTQELEFFDVFAMHASSALANAGILK